MTASPRTWSRRLALWLSALIVGAGLTALSMPVTQAAAGAPYAKRLTGFLTTPDGVKLRYSVMLPKASGRFPVAMVYNGYDAGSLGGPAWLDGSTWMSQELESDMLRHGYAVMGLQMRGTGCSSGTFDLFTSRWGTDGAQGVEWAARQPWSTGRVGMFEWSWPGISQLFTAAQRPRGLAAIAPGMVVTDPLRDVGAPGGVPNLSFPTLWWGTIQAAWAYAGQSAAQENDGVCLQNLARNVAEGQLHSPTTLSAHMYRDSFWAARDLLGQTGRIRVPVLSMVDWQDEEVGARGGYYQNRLDPDRTWLVGTNGQHDSYLSRAYRTTLFAFFDHYLKGRNNGFELTPHVQLWQDTTAAGGAQSSDEQLTESRPSFVVSQKTFPARVRANRLYFTATGGLVGAKPSGVTGQRSFVAQPGPVVNNDIPSAATGDEGGPAGELPWTLSSPSAGGLTYTSTPLARSAVIAGSSSVDVWVSSTLPAGALQVTLSDVRPDGQEVYLQRGWLDLTQRALDAGASTPLLPIHPQTMAAVQPMTPGQAVLVRVEIPNVSHTFRKGSAIRITLDAPSSTGDWVMGSVASGLYGIGSNALQPSSIVLGVMRTGVNTGPLVSCALLSGTPCRANTVAVPAGAAPALRAP